jgi:hypothetical protein
VIPSAISPLSSTYIIPHLVHLLGQPSIPASHAPARHIVERRVDDGVGGEVCEVFYLGTLLVPSGRPHNVPFTFSAAPLTRGTSPIPNHLSFSLISQASTSTLVSYRWVWLPGRTKIYSSPTSTRTVLVLVRKELGCADVTISRRRACQHLIFLYPHGILYACFSVITMAPLTPSKRARLVERYASTTEIDHRPSITQKHGSSRQGISTFHLWSPTPPSVGERTRHSTRYLEPDGRASLVIRTSVDWCETLPNNVATRGTTVPEGQ